MSAEGCDWRCDCGFFAKFGKRQSNVWKGLVGFYCLGRGFHLCERRHGYLSARPAPNDDVMPNGQEVSKAFLALT